ncbi:MAG: sulfatase-like hydrolase/transferase, partial [Candidatus Omnitrophica bacterium]|nr:sulfatase-like hydrolase/transferase [Candidatus Omnitrophota bacterium]
MLRQTAAAGALLLAPRCARTEDPPHRKPNFVFILIDDMGWKDAGFMGSPCYETPRVDRLARQGIVFTSAYTNAPNCAPTRACIMSGQYGPRHGIFTVGTSERGKSRDRKLIPIENNTRLSPDVVTLAESLRRGGYVCGHVGKWHLGDEGETGPLAQGFDHRFGANWG